MGRANKIGGGYIMAHAGRPKLFKVTENQFRDIWLDYLVDENGKKVSWRKLIKDKKFQDETGYFRVTANGQRKPVSIGSASYWLAEFKLYDEELFNYHQEITKRIPLNKTYETWKSENIENNSSGNLRLDLLDDKLVRKALTLIAKQVEYFKSKCTEYDDIYNFFDSLSRERSFKSKEKLVKTFKSVYKSLQEKGEVIINV
jgi:hypothetical protein